MRGASRVLAVLSTCLGWPGKIPHWTTGRLWLLRLGHARLTEPLEQADDWAWLADHSVQFGQDKCLAVLGLRLAYLPPQGQCLRAEDLKRVALVPMRSSTRQEVKEELEKARPRTGTPRLIVDDHGVDLSGGVRFFRAEHPATAEVYDLKHKAACLLKGRLEKDARFKEFSGHVVQTRSVIQQTELAFLLPPGPRPKARFMNLGPLLRGGQRVLGVLQTPMAEVLRWTSGERLQEKLGWLWQYQADLAEWAEWQSLVDATVLWVARQGLSPQTAAELSEVLPWPRRHLSSGLLALELTGFVQEQARACAPGERFPGSTEVLESCFGRFKALEGNHGKGGLTGLLLSFGALLGPPTATPLRQAMQASSTAAVRRWCKDNLGTTVHAKRAVAFRQATGATNTG